MGMCLVIGDAVPLTLLEMITETGLTSNLVLCLDAGDSASYSGSGQTWTDVSGNSNSFFRGSSSSSQSSDPTFNGSAGAKTSSEYFSFDGGDYFTETTSHTFADLWHKNNGVFTLVAAIYYVDNSSTQIVFSTAESSSEVGLNIMVSSVDDAPHVNCYSGGGVALTLDSTNALTNAAWNFYAVAVNEATGADGATAQTNGTQSSHTSTYSSPSSSNPSQSYRIGHNGGSVFIASGARIGCLAAWSTRLADADLTALYNQLSARYGF